MFRTRTRYLDCDSESSASDADADVDDGEIATYGSDDDGRGAVGSRVRLSAAERAAEEARCRVSRHNIIPEGSRRGRVRARPWRLRDDDDDDDNNNTGGVAQLGDECELVSLDTDEASDGSSGGAGDTQRGGGNRPHKRLRKANSSTAATLGATTTTTARPAGVVAATLGAPSTAAPCAHTLMSVAHELYASLLPHLRAARRAGERRWYAFGTRLHPTAHAWARTLAERHLGCTSAAYTLSEESGAFAVCADEGAGARFATLLETNCAPDALGLPAGAWRVIYRLRERRRSADAMRIVREWSEVPPGDETGGDADNSVDALLESVRERAEARAQLTRLADFLNDTAAAAAAAVAASSTGAPAAAAPGYVPRFGTLDAAALRRAATAATALRDDIVGQSAVKRSLADYIIGHLCWQDGSSEVGNNFVFYGAPGVAKTAVARLFAEIVVALRLFDPPSARDLEDICESAFRTPEAASAARSATPRAADAVVNADRTAARSTAEAYQRAFAAAGDAQRGGGGGGAVFCEANRGTLVDLYAGGTGPKTARALLGWLGRVGFIDEAYGIAYPQDSFGAEAAGTLVALLTRIGRSLGVIMAGQRDAFEQNLYAVNPGVESRFRAITFTRYNAAELAKIFMLRMLGDGIARFSVSGAAAVVTAATLGPPDAPPRGAPLEAERAVLLRFFARPAVLDALRNENGRGVATLVDLSIKAAVAAAAREESLLAAHRRALGGAPAVVVRARDLETAWSNFIAGN